MKISINLVLAHCTLFYFQYFLQLTLELVAQLHKKDAICVKFGTRTKKNSLVNL